MTKGVTAVVSHVVQLESATQKALDGTQTTKHNDVQEVSMAVKSASDKQQLLENLRQKIQGVSDADRITDNKTFTSGCNALDRLLPAGGYTRGTINQWFNPPSHNKNHLTSGHGAEWLSLLAARNACHHQQAMVIIDPDHSFNPAAAAALGIALSRLIVIRPPTPCTHHRSNDLMWSIDQSLRCHAVGAVWGMIGNADPRWLRRFQLSAEQSGVMGFFVRPGHCASHPSWAEIDWQVLSRKNSKYLASQQPSHAFPMSLRLLRAPGGYSERDITIQINTITGSVQEARVDHATNPLRLVTQLAHSTPGCRTATS